MAPDSKPPDTVKQCKCGRAFTASEWSGLPYVGEQVTWGRGGGRPEHRLELRNCACGSTISTRLKPRLQEG